MEQKLIIIVVVVLVLCSSSSAAAAAGGLFGGGNKCVKLNKGYIKKDSEAWTDGDRNTAIWLLGTEKVTTQGQGMTNAQLKPLLDNLCEK